MHNLWAPRDSFKLCSPHIHEKLLNISLSYFMMMIVPLKHTQTQRHTHTHARTSISETTTGLEKCACLSHVKNTRF